MNRTSAHQTKLLAAATGKRWCTTCNSEQLESRGAWRTTKTRVGQSIRRWCCGTCAARSGTSWMSKPQ